MGIAPATRRLLGPCLALALAGCQVPAARFATATPGATTLPCPAVFAWQIAEDSAWELACHPWRCGQTVFAEPVQCLWALGRGAIGKRLLLPLAPAPPALPLHETSSPEIVAAELTDLLGPDPQPAEVYLYADGAEALTALKRLIAGATRQIDVLMFQWENDALGAELAAGLAAKAGPDLRVRVLVDGGGNLLFGEPTHSHPADVNGAVSALARQPYVDVIRTRNPFGRVDHRKLVVVDGRIAWTGGRNFTRQSFFDQRDLSVTVAGPVAAELAKAFAAFWIEQGGDAEASGGRQPPVSSPRLGTRHHQGADAPRSPANARARVVWTGPMRHDIEHLLYQAVDRARHHVYLENYTFCDSLLIYKLAQARRRGVDVRVVLTFSDCTEALNRANRVIANRLRGAGVRVYVYPGMTHAKAAVVDGGWAYLGTGNFDPLSLRRNLELGVALGESPVVAELERVLFAQDFRPEWELQEPLPLTWADYASELLASFCL